MTADDVAHYERLRHALAGQRLPVAIVDLDAFDANQDRVLEVLRGTGKTLRVATKSLRVPDLVRRLAERGADTVRGLMAYAAGEAAFLADQGFDDILIAYPTVQRDDVRDIAAITAAGKTVRTVVDGPAHIEALAAAARERAVVCEAVIELDVSWRPLGNALHLGVRRSPIRTPEAAVDLLRFARRTPGVEVTGLMAYEALIAGLPDASPAQPLLAGVKRWLKRAAAPAAERLRARTAEALQAAGARLALVNGGGTGSLERTARDPSVTEVTVGSAFLASHLFDRYARCFTLRPAAAFALPVARASDEGFVTCHGGGFAALGAAGPDRLPVPWLPPGLALLPHEGAGEVQTPLSLARCPVALAPGDPVFFRHAKAGELAEHFEEYLLIREDRVTGRARTYRGVGRRFP